MPIRCSLCGRSARYAVAERTGWIAVKGEVFTYYCGSCVAINQCDGCRRGLPLDNNGVHRGKGFDAIGCTRERYTRKFRTECRTCGHVEHHDAVTDFAEERCDVCNSLSFGQNRVTRR